ncbi:MAG TPA: hypothetical protein VE684_22035 [Crenalkalicoccus sp.]|nr:hypothetical protein [Crenalkalicoccus sp.]
MDGTRAALPASYAVPEEGRRAEWHRYYAAKRIRHQNLQLELIGQTAAQRILEVGPYLGYVTALLENAGYAVTTLDLGPQRFARPAVPHIAMDLTAPEPARMAGHDLVLCCETLEHLPRPAAEGALAAFRASGARWLLLSVPYSGPCLFWEAHWAPGWWRSLLFAKWKEALRRFEPEPDPLGHKWELGTLGLPVRGWEDAIRGAGWRVLDRRFTAPTRAVFHLCEAAS